MKIQSMRDLKKEMLSVARGERKAPTDAAQTSFEPIKVKVAANPPPIRRT